MQLKILITLFQKMIWFIDVWATFHEILAIQIPKRCWLSRNLTEFLKTVSHGTINNKNFWECFCREISALTVCNIQFWILKYSKFIFMCLTPPPIFGPFRLLNTSIFGQTLPTQTVHHNSLESRHPEVTKSACYGLFTLQSQIPIFLGSSSRNICFSHDFIIALCLVLIEWEKSVKYLWKLIYIESV